MTALFIFDPYPGNSRPVILIHGLGSDFTSWQFQIKPLAEAGFRPIAIDVPGFGRSGYQFNRWNVRNAALTVIHELVDALEEPVILVGLSLGGTIAQTIYLFRPEKISKMVLASTFSKLRPSPGQNLPYLTRRMAQMARGNIQQQAKSVADRIFPEEEQRPLHDYLFEQIKQANPKIYRQSMLSLGLFNSTRWMKHCSIPVQVISGSEDSTVTLKNQIRMVKTIPLCEHIIICGGGHAVSVDHTEQFNQSLLEFLQRK